jgi:hypothetical protein
LNIMDYSLLVGVHMCSKQECDCTQDDPIPITRGLDDELKQKVKKPAKEDAPQEEGKDPQSPRQISKSEPNLAHPKSPGPQEPFSRISQEILPRKTSQPERPKAREFEDITSSVDIERKKRTSADNIILSSKEEVSPSPSETTTKNNTTGADGSPRPRRKLRFRDNDEYQSDPEDLRRSQIFTEENKPQLQKLVKSAKTRTTFEGSTPVTPKEENAFSAFFRSASGSIKGSGTKGHRRAVSVSNDELGGRKQSMVQTTLPLPKRFR